MKMKCKHCGAKLGKTDEICPNCSKFVSDKAAETPVIQTEITSTETKIPDPRFSESDTVFDYKDHILASLLWSLGFALFFGILLVFFSFDDSYFSSEDFYSLVLAVVVIGLSVFSGVATYINEKKCFIVITDEKVYGTIPKGMLDTTDFEVEISDIVCVEKEGFHGKHSTPKIVIVTKENNIEIKASSSKLLSAFKNKLQERIVENETRI